MIEYANETVIKLLKQYDMFSKSLNFTTDLKQKNDICSQMTKIIQNVLEITNTIYESKYLQIEKRSVYLMEEEKNRLLELINLVNERRVYINNQVTSNRELTGIGIDAGTILGEDKLEEYKNQVKIIDRYKSNMKLESVLKEEIKSLDSNIRKANDKISNNKNLNKQLEDRMIRLLENAFEKLSLYELRERQKEIDLAYTELGYSLEKAKENAKIARRDCTEEIILECDNMLASITLEYERYKEKKLILKLMDLFKTSTTTYDELVSKREDMNNILVNITDSELYKMVGNELNKEYATIKLEGQDVATLKSLMEERDVKNNTLKDIEIENNSEEFKGLLANLLENEKRYQEKLLLEKKKKEQERLEKERLAEKKKQEELAERQKALEEERKKEIERRTKELLVEKKNPILNPTREEKRKETSFQKKSPVVPKRELNFKTPEKTTKSSVTSQVSTQPITREEKNKNNPKIETSKSMNADIFSKTLPSQENDFFKREVPNSKITEKGIPVIKNNNLDNKIVSAQKMETKEEKIFPNIPLEKKENIFPDFPEVNKNSSFFDENEFNDLSNYMEEDDKKSWF